MVVPKVSLKEALFVTPLQHSPWVWNVLYKDCLLSAGKTENSAWAHTFLSCLGCPWVGL